MVHLIYFYWQITSLFFIFGEAQNSKRSGLIQQDNEGNSRVDLPFEFASGYTATVSRLPKYGQPFTQWTSNFPNANNDSTLIIGLCGFYCPNGVVLGVYELQSPFFLPVWNLTLPVPTQWSDSFYYPLSLSGRSIFVFRQNNFVKVDLKSGQISSRSISCNWWDTYSLGSTRIYFNCWKHDYATYPQYVPFFYWTISFNPEESTSSVTTSPLQPFCNFQGNAVGGIPLTADMLPIILRNDSSRCSQLLVKIVTCAGYQTPLFGQQDFIAYDSITLEICWTVSSFMMIYFRFPVIDSRTSMLYVLQVAADNTASTPELRCYYLTSSGIQFVSRIPLTASGYSSDYSQMTLSPDSTQLFIMYRRGILRFNTCKSTECVLTQEFDLQTDGNYGSSALVATPSRLIVNNGSRCNLYDLSNSGSLLWSYEPPASILNYPLTWFKSALLVAEGVLVVTGVGYTNEPPTTTLFMLLSESAASSVSTSSRVAFVFMIINYVCSAILIAFSLAQCYVRYGLSSHQKQNMADVPLVGSITSDSDQYADSPRKSVSCARRCFYSTPPPTGFFAKCCGATKSQPLAISFIMFMSLALQIYLNVLAYQTISDSAEAAALATAPFQFDNIDAFKSSYLTSCQPASAQLSSLCVACTGTSIALTCYMLHRNSIVLTASSFSVSVSALVLLVEKNYFATIAVRRFLNESIDQKLSFPHLLVSGFIYAKRYYSYADVHIVSARISRVAKFIIPFIIIAAHKVTA